MKLKNIFSLSGIPGVRVLTLTLGLGTLDCLSQNNSIILDGAYIVLDGGTSAANVYVVINQNSNSGIIRTGAGGHIISENQYNYVKWNSGTSTGNYVFPFGVGGNAADYIPFTFNKTTAGSSDISMSTWTSNSSNVPWAGVSNVAAVTDMNITGGPDLSIPSVIDRWWDIQSPAPVTADLTFSYRGIENTTAVPLDTFQAQHWNGTAWDPQAGPATPGVTTGIGTVGPILGQTTFSPWVLTRSGLNAIITTSQNPVCNNQCTGSAEVTAAGGSPSYTYSWNTTPVQTTQTATGLCMGSYTVTVTDGTAVTTTATVTITEPTAITLTATATPAVCGNNGSATVNAGGGTPGYFYNWDPSSGGQTTATATGLAAGTYTATVTDANNCITTETVTVVSSGSSTTTNQAASICSGSSYTLPGGAVVSVGGTYNDTLTASNGCDSIIITALTVNSVSAASQLASICSGSTYTLPGGTIVSTGGTYVDTLTSANGCDSIITTNLTVNPISTANQSASICSGFTYTLPGGTVVITGGTYMDTLTAANGCDSIITTNLTVNPNPTAAVFSIPAMSGQVITITQGQSATLTASGGGSYSWNNGTNGTSITVTPLLTTLYCVTVTDTNNCIDTACITVNIDIPCADLFIPNAFSPNNDGKNDLVCVRGNNCIQTLHFAIYDRWGGIVFQTSDLTNTCWDGIYKGKLPNTAVFMYYLEGTLISGEQITKTGNITLVK